MEFNELNENFNNIENLSEINNKIQENTEPIKSISEDFLERLEQEKNKVSFGSLNDEKYRLEQYEKAKEEYKYRVELLDKSLEKGKNSYNEGLDVKYAKKAVEREAIDLKYANKNNS